METLAQCCIVVSVEPPGSVINCFAAESLGYALDHHKWLNFTLIGDVAVNGFAGRVVTEYGSQSFSLFETSVQQQL